jgi:hypothetical protein
MGACTEIDRFSTNFAGAGKDGKPEGDSGVLAVGAANISEPVLISEASCTDDGVLAIVVFSPPEILETAIKSRFSHAVMGAEFDRLAGV